MSFSLKYLPYLLLVPLCMILQGCQLTQLTVEEHGQEWAPALGIDPSNMRYINHAGFATVDRSDSKRPDIQQGVVILTNQAVILAEESPDASDSVLIKSIPISDIQGVGLIPNQVQLHHEDQVTLVRLYGDFRHQVFVPLAEAFFGQLLAMGCPEIEVKNVYGFYRNMGRSEYMPGDPSIDSGAGWSGEAAYNVQ